MSIRVIKEKCRGCTLCVKSCPFEAIKMSDRLPEIGAACTECGACLEACKFGALEKVDDGAGEGMDIGEYHDVWVFAEQRDNKLMPVVIELMGEGRRLADEIGCRLGVIVCGENIDRITYELGCYGADLIYSADAPELRTYTTDAYTKVIYEAVIKYKPEILLLGATHIGRDLGPSIAVKCGTGLTADCTKLEINPEDKKLMQTRPAFGGNLMATIVCEKHRPQMATVRPKVFKVPQPDFSRRGKVLRPAFSLPEPLWLRHLAHIHAEDEGPSILDAEIIVSVGRGMSSDRNLALARELAQLLGGALACSRPLVDTGVLPPRHQVGQTGRTVSPKLYIALGISGAIQHLAGIGGVESVVAVNKDPEAPIFSIAHYCIVGDCAEFAEALVAELKRRKSGDCYE